MKTLSFLRRRVLVTFNCEKRGFDISIVRSVKYVHSNTPYKYFIGLDDDSYIYSACKRLLLVEIRSFHCLCVRHGFTEKRAFECLLRYFGITEFL